MLIYSIDDFLDRLTGCVGHHPDPSRRVAVRLTTPVDFLVVGRCSNHDRGDPIDDVEGLKARSAKNTRYGPQAGQTIIIMSSCCGQYREHDRERLRAALPGIEILFPQHSDYGGKFNVLQSEEGSYRGRQITDDLVAASLIETAPP